jgi:hypothetical protein
MNNLRTVGCIILGASLISACATKRYPIATPLGVTEQSAMTCRELDLELIRTEEVRTQISQTATTDWRSVAGFLGDYGIGNAMAKNDADKAINARVQSVRAARVAKGCGTPVGALDRFEAWVSGLLG